MKFDIVEDIVCCIETIAYVGPDLITILTSLLILNASLGGRGRVVVEMSYILAKSGSPKRKGGGGEAKKEARRGASFTTGRMPRWALFMRGFLIELNDDK